MAKPPRNRGKNFDSSEIQLLTEMVEKNIDVLNSKLTNDITYDRKQSIWEDITTKINSLGVAVRNVKEIKTKWTNLHQTAKKEFSENKISQRKTGGGPCPKAVSSVSEKIVDIFKDSPTFNGPNGFKTQAPETDEGCPPVIGSPETVSILNQILNKGSTSGSDHAMQHIGFHVVEVEADGPVLTEELSVVQHKETSTETESSLNHPIPTPRSESAQRVKEVRRNKEKIKAEDVTRMQYEVLLEQKRKLQEQTTYYKLMNKKLRMEMNSINED